MSKESEDNNLLNRLENIEKRIESIEGSLARLVQDAERRTERREAAWIVIGVILGGLLSISVNFYTEYYMLAVSPKIDIATLVAVTVGLVAGFGFLLWWAINRLH